MDRNQPWIQQGYLTKNDYETAQLADYVKNYPWEEISKRADLFDSILNQDDFSPANKIRSDRMFLLGDLFKDIQKIPEPYYSAALFRFANADLKNGTWLETQFKEFWPEVELKENINLSELQTEAKKIANGLGNLYKIALYDKAQDDLNTVQVLKNHSQEDLKQLREKVKAIDKVVATKISNQEPIDKKIEGLAEVIQVSGRTNMEIDDIFASDDIYKTKSRVVRIIQTMMEATGLVLQAYKDNSIDKLSTAEGLVEVFERFLADRIDQFYKEITTRGPSGAAINPPTA